MNILMMTNTYTPHVGGVARSVTSFAQAYRTLGHRVVVVAPQFEGAPPQEPDVIRVPAIQNFNGSDFSVPMPIPGYLNSSMEEFKPDIIHVHHPFLLGDTALRMAAVRNIPVVFTHHTQYDCYTHYVANDSAALRRFVVDLVIGYCNLCDAVIAPSESIAAALIGSGVSTRIEVIPTGIDLQQFSRGDGAAFRAAFNIPAHAYLVGHVGRLAPEKNLEFLAQAVATFVADRPDAYFLVVGGGPSAEQIRHIFTRHGLSERLYLTGSVDGQQLIDAYKAMDVFAFASLTETQGLVLTEAMAAGVPVVALNATGVREVVVDKHNGRLLQGQDTAQFAAALQWMAALPPAARLAMVSAAQHSAAAFAMPLCAARALALYKSLLGGGHANRTSATKLWTKTLHLIDEEWKIMTTKAKAAGAALRKSGTSSEISH